MVPPQDIPQNLLKSEHKQRSPKKAERNSTITKHSSRLHADPQILHRLFNCQLHPFCLPAKAALHRFRRSPAQRLSHSFPHQKFRRLLLQEKIIQEFNTLQNYL
jgi:hypothetical protein